uniref:Uncharacterized protein n=1 Tax=Oryza rufipogon TaxID=4529 RepID=A0A0E0Q7G9_ORYRU
MDYKDYNIILILLDGNRTCLATNGVTSISSCGLFMLKIMENWTGESLSRSITQEDITLFRFKLAAVITTGEQSKDTKDSDDDVVILGSHQRKFNSKRDIYETKEVNKKYSSLLFVVATMSKQELISGLLHYIQ